MPEKQYLSAIESQPTSAYKLSAALNTTNRVDKSTSMGGISNFDPNNRFRYYQQLATCSPHVSVPLNKLGLMLAKGLKFDGKKTALKEFVRWGEKTNFIEQVSTAARLMCRDGTYIAKPVGKAETYTMNPLLMPYTTILPDNMALKSTPKDIMQPHYDRIVVREGESSATIWTLDDVIMGSISAWDYVQVDTRNRETFGIFGSSLMDPIELSIRNLLNINSGFVSFVRRYGLGRYHYDHQMLQHLVESETISPGKATEIHNAWLENNKNLSENEDISGVGLVIKPIDAHGSLSVQDFKNSLEIEISLGLFQSAITMGKASGTTYASGYLVEDERMVVLEGLQRILQNLTTQMINGRLESMGKPPDSVWVEFEELSKIKLTPSEAQEMFNTGVIDVNEFREWGGFSLMVPEDEI